MKEPASDASLELSDWVNAYGDELFRWAYYKTSNRELAEDLVQESFLSAFANHRSFKKESNPRTWLFTILNNKIIDHYRSARNKRTVTASTLDEQEAHQLFDRNGMWAPTSVTTWDQEPLLLDNPEFLAVFHRCMEALPERWRAVTQAKFIHHKKGNEICQDMDITPSNLWQIVHRSKLQLKKCLDQKWKQDG